MTFRELFLKIADTEEMRIYEPNRDCMIWETWKETHCPYTLIEKDNGYIDWDFTSRNDYFENTNEIRILHSLDNIDAQTTLFLKKFADYEVTGIECGSYTSDYLNDPDISVEYKPCLDVFICAPDPDHTRECERCIHSNFIDDDTVYRGWSCVPDKDDAECKKCWRNINECNVKPTANTSSLTSNESDKKDEKRDKAIK